MAKPFREIEIARLHDSEEIQAMTLEFADDLRAYVQREGSLFASYDLILSTLGPPNAETDPPKVYAAWRIEYPSGEVLELWSWHHQYTTTCIRWGVGGAISIAEDLFPGRVRRRRHA